MKPGIVTGVKGLVTENIAVCPCVKKGLIGMMGLLSDREGHGTVRPQVFDLRNQMYHAVICEPAVLTPLEYESAEPQGIAFPAAGEYLLFSETVAVHIAVAFLNAAVIAVVFTVVCKFDQTADIDAVSVMVMPHFS